MAKNRSRRLRKKLMVDEFATFGFEVKCDFDHQVCEEHEQFFDDFIDFIESEGLLFFGGISVNYVEGFVFSQARYESPTEEHKAELKAWLEQKTQCSNIQISDFIDVNAFQ